MKNYFRPDKGIKKELKKYKSKGYSTKNEYINALLKKGLIYQEKIEE